MADDDSKKFDVPDLDFAAVPAPRPVSSPSAAPRPQTKSSRSASPPANRASSVQDYFGSGSFNDDFEEHGAGAAIELGEDAEAAMAAGANLTDLDDFQRGATGSPVEAQGRAQPQRKAPAARPSGPTATSPDRAALKIDAVEIALCADFGPAPTSPLGLPAYALRVRSRSAVLRAAVASCEHALLAAETRRDAMLAEVVEDQKSVLVRDESLQPLLGPVIEQEAVARERRQALMAANEQFSSEATQIDLELQHAASEIGEAQSVADQLEAELKGHEERFARADAKLKRARIEVRSATQVAEQAAALGAASPDQIAKLEQLQAAADALEPGVHELGATRDAAKARVREQRAVVDRWSRQRREIETRLRALDQTFKKQLGVREAGVGEAESGYKKALADVGRALLASRGTGPLSRDEVAALTAFDAEVLSLAAQAEKQLRALDSADPEAVKRGYMILGGAALLVVILLVLMLTMCGSGTPAPAPTTDP